MGLSTALYNAISGLNSQSHRISNVSNNLANSSTTSYKACATLFEDMISASTMTDSGGVSATTKYLNGKQGNIQSVSPDTYMAISGNGYFPVTSATQNPDGSYTIGTEVLYTRSGDFSLNADGYMTNQEGYYLLGWAVDPVTGAVDTNTLVPVQISDLIDAPVATGNVKYEANLPADANVGMTPSASLLTIYDSTTPPETDPTNNEHQLSYTWTKTGTNTWDLTIAVPGGAWDGTTAHDYSATVTFTFDEHGKIANINDNGTGVTVDGTTVSFPLAFQNGSSQTVASDFSAMTQFADKGVFTKTVFAQDGVPPGSFSRVGLDESGFVSIIYDNGQSSTHYQVAIATFLAEDYLERESGNAFRTSAASGLADYNAAGDNGAGTIKTNALEDSTVDIAGEFTNLIAAQQAYSANAKTITTVDNMLQTLVNLTT